MWQEGLSGDEGEVVAEWIGWGKLAEKGGEGQDLLPGRGTGWEESPLSGPSGYMDIYRHEEDGGVEPFPRARIDRIAPHHPPQPKLEPLGSATGPNIAYMPPQRGGLTQNSLLKSGNPFFPPLPVRVKKRRQPTVSPVQVFQRAPQIGDVGGVPGSVPERNG